MPSRKRGGMNSQSEIGRRDPATDAERDMAAGRAATAVPPPPAETSESDEPDIDMPPPVMVAASADGTTRFGGSRFGGGGVVGSDEADRTVLQGLLHELLIAGEPTGHAIAGRETDGKRRQHAQE